METKFTKGQWALDICERANGEHDISIVSRRECKLICDMKKYASHAPIENEEYEANAKLIAAAPELLKALIEVKLWLEDMKLPRLINVEEAIKKATE